MSASEVQELIDLYLDEDARAAQHAVPDKTLTDLDWFALVEALEHHCHSTAAVAASKRLPFLSQQTQVARRLAEVDEAYRLVLAGDTPPLGGFSDLSEQAIYCKRGGVLEGPHLLDLARVAEIAQDMSDYFSTRSKTHPHLGESADGLVPLGGLAQSIRYALSEDGEVLDRASADLGTFRARVRSHTTKVRERVDSYLKDRDFEALLQDQYFTIRDDRFVLPIRVGDQSAVPGIVHGRSGSGQTVYIEPTELVEINNALSLAQLAVEQEILKILARLSKEVGKCADALIANTRRLIYLDLSVAAGRLGLEMAGVCPTLAAGEVRLEKARHPLLALRDAATDGEFETIPNDIVFGGDGQHVLLISGPNAGGKTVVLKTIGLYALMIRAGLLVPAGEHSALPVFSEIFSDIGDEQSLADDLSSFSAHVTHMKAILPKVGSGTLVLLDELFSGTDPIQGAALGAALLESLAEKGALIGASTHFEPLKRFALESKVVTNASMGFEVSTLSPTFKLQIGLPGSSNALRIARKMGFPTGLLTRAEFLANEEGSNELEGLLNELDSYRTRLQRREDDLNAAVRKANESEREYLTAQQKLKRQALSAVDDEVESIYKEIAEARALVQRRRKLLGRRGEEMTEADLVESQTDLNEAKNLLAELQQDRQRGEVRKSRKPIDEAELAVGAEVWVGPVKRAGTVLSFSKAKKRVQVQVGNVKASFSPADLYESEPSEGVSRPKTKSVSKKPTTRVKKAPPVQMAPQNANNTFDIRGQRVEAALDELERRLDTAYGLLEPGIFVIHGHGTGALRDAVRQYARQSAYVASQRPGERGEGGDGVTLLMLKST